jgi:hypothetical protein
VASVRGQARKRETLLAIVGALVVGLATMFALPGAATEAPSPGVDEIASSANMRQLANIPKQGTFNTTDALGSDIAFQGDHAFVGNYEGFVIYDISRPSRPRIVSQVQCPGPQNDVSVAGDLLFLSTDSSRSDDSCQSTQLPATEKSAWEGIKIFDISDLRNPRYIKSVETNCGSHTHTLVPGGRGTVYLYVQSYSPNATFPDCQPPHDKISIIKVPVQNPTAAAVVATPVLFPDGGNPGDGQSFPEGTTATSGCHDITAFPDKDLAAGACMGDGMLWDISDRLNPRLLDSVRDDTNFAFWHSATFNKNATKVVYTDELGGGGAPTCNTTIGADKGADGIYDIVGRGDARHLVFRGRYKIPRAQADTENCVAHNGSLIPVRGRDIMVQAWYQGGISVWDFTDSTKAHEIGFFERGPLSADELVVGGPWSAYYYNGHIYSSDIQKGLDVIKINDRRTNGAARVDLNRLNVQTQPSYAD